MKAMDGFFVMALGSFSEPDMLEVERVKIKTEERSRLLCGHSK